MNTSTPARSPGAHRKAALWEALVLALAMVWPVAACASSNTGPSDLKPGGGAVSSAGTPAPSASASPTTPAAQSAPQPSASRATAQRELDSFMTKASSMDRALRAAAALVNAGISSETINVNPGAFAAVDAVDPHSLISALPGGMPTGLKQQSLLVFSDLVARRYAYQSLLQDRREMPLLRLSRDGRKAIAGLANGAVPAARFPGDLAALRSASSAAAAFTPVAASSRATAEIAVRAAYIIGRNSGCAESGGWVEAQLLPLVWKQGTDVFGQNTDGSIAGVTFRATYRPGQGWSIQLSAC